MIERHVQMKTNILKPLSTLLILAILTISCKEKNAEKTIAEASDKPVPTITPTATPAEAKPDGPVAAMSFAKMEHDFGTINEGQVVEYTYEFTNTGEVPLVISGVQGSCGCTVPDWTKEPVPVGGKGFVKAKFDSSNKSQRQTKTVTVTANTYPAKTELRFHAMVTPKKAPAGGAPYKH